MTILFVSHEKHKVVHHFLSFVLLIGAALFVASFQRTSALSPGFAVEEIVTAPLRVELLRYTEPRARTFYRDVVERASALPGVDAVSLVRTVPLAAVSAPPVEAPTAPLPPMDPKLRDDLRAASERARQRVAAEASG